MSCPLTTRSAGFPVILYGYHAVRTCSALRCAAAQLKRSAGIKQWSIGIIRNCSVVLSVPLHCDYPCGWATPTLARPRRCSRCGSTTATASPHRPPRCSKTQTPPPPKRTTRPLSAPRRTACGKLLTTSASFIRPQRPPCRRRWPRRLPWDTCPSGLPVPYCALVGGAVLNSSGCASRSCNMQQHVACNT